MRNVKMVCYLSFLGFFLIFLANVDIVVEASQNYEVGDALGWREPAENDTEIYIHWATTKRFQVGDTLSFEYKNDSVLVVNKWEYYHCSTDKPFNAFTNGSTVIELERVGPFYFISGIPKHCKRGQRLHVITTSRLPIPAPHPFVAVSPAPFVGDPPADTPLAMNPGDSVSVAFGSLLLALFAAFLA